MWSNGKIQTKGLKRHFAEESWKEFIEKSGQTVEPVQIVNEEEASRPKRIKLKVKRPEKEDGKKIRQTKCWNLYSQVLRFWVI